MLFDPSRSPRKRNGRITTQGNFVDSKAILNTAGTIIAVTHRIVFQVSVFVFSDFVTDRIEVGSGVGRD